MFFCVFGGWWGVCYGARCARGRCGELARECEGEGARHERCLALRVMTWSKRGCACGGGGGSLIDLDTLLLCGGRVRGGGAVSWRESGRVRESGVRCE